MQLFPRRVKSNYKSKSLNLRLDMEISQLLLLIGIYKQTFLTTYHLRMRHANFLKAVSPNSELLKTIISRYYLIFNLCNLSNFNSNCFLQRTHLADRCLFDPHCRLLAGKVLFVGESTLNGFVFVNHHFPRTVLIICLGAVEDTLSEFGTDKTTVLFESLITNVSLDLNILIEGTGDLCTFILKFY